MARKKININLNEFFDSFYEGGICQIYVDKKQEARARAFLKEFDGGWFYGGPFLDGYVKGSEKFGNRVLKIVKRCLKNGSPPQGASWPPHSIATIKALGEHTLMNWTGQYRRSVGIYQHFNKANTYTYVGLPERVKKSRKKGSSRKTLVQVAKLLEYGSRDGHLPPRPLWRPAYKEAGGDEVLYKDIRFALQREITKRMRKYNY